jgi:hypothetical protein
MQKIRYLIPALITCLVIWLLFMLMKQPQSDGIEILEHEYSPRLRALYKKVCTLHKKPIRVIEIKGPSPRTTVARVLSPRRTRLAIAASHAAMSRSMRTPRESGLASSAAIPRTPIPHPMSASKAGLQHRATSWTAEIMSGVSEPGGMTFGIHGPEQAVSL